MRKLVALADRTAVLFLGVAAGAAIGYAFGRSGERSPERAVIKPAPIAAAAKPGAPPAARVDPRGFEFALPFQQHLLDTVKAGKPVTVGVFGDSFGDGVWSALYRLLPASEHFRVLKYSQQSTGFTRYSSLNLEEHAQEQLAADGPVDVAVISFGANDTQGVYSGRHAAALMSPEWQRVIGERVDRFVALLRARGAMVYWVGLPKMRKASFDDDIAGMNDFYTARMKALNVPFIDIKPLTVDGAGEFAQYLPDPVSHERRLLRANDGVHMSMNGYVVITRSLAERIKAYVAAARAKAGVGAVPLPVAKPVHVAAPEAAKVEPEKHGGKRHDDPRKPEAGEHRDKTSERRHHDAGDKAPSEPKRDAADKPQRPREEREKQRPAASEKHDGETRERAKKPAEESKPRAGEPKSGEAKPSSSRASEIRATMSEISRSADRDKPGESKPRSTDAKPKPTDAKRTDGKPKSGDAPPKPRRHRDEPGNSGEGNSQ